MRYELVEAWLVDKAGNRTAHYGMVYDNQEKSVVIRFSGLEAMEQAQEWIDRADTQTGLA